MLKKTLYTLILFITLSVSCNAPKTENVKTVEIPVEGMTCEGCEKTIAINVNELQGIQKVEASFQVQKVKVSFDTLKLSLVDIENKIAAAGYQVIK